MLNNDISLTIRIPSDLNEVFSSSGKSLGFTKTNYLRFAIHKFLSDMPTDISKVDTSYYSGKPFRFVLNINEPTNQLLQDASQKYELSINAVITRLCILGLEYFSK